ncbi:1-phosphofructokinase [Fusobacterium gastrosuis]|uniref:1-phosphofructokinase n=1 Tax=Fusobacterium gastrosuis TaxID=1755100 RepID=UPI0029728020|nr:1-phosphofructokinase [Fusobacteriaceae bacterium]MDY5712982.1 1-phosphofructokinase [Fusobacterium gastrosuis]
MIYSVTLNPSIDFIVRVKDFKEGETNRAYADEFYAGGKGIMVSKLLKNVGTDCINLGFLGGFTGKFIELNLDKLNIKHDFIQVEDNTRINVKLKSSKETEINCKGPTVSKEAIDNFLDKIRNIKKEDFVILSGSVPAGLGTDFYTTIMEILSKNKINFTLDSSGEAFKKSLEYKPFLVKPNKDEISEFAKKKLESKDEIINFVRKNLLEKAHHVIVSMGGEGALYIAKDYVLFASALKGNLVNSVGAGDSVVAGFVDSMLKGSSVEEAFRFAVACGTATAFSEDIGKLKFIEELKNKLIIERM